MGYIMTSKTAEPDNHWYKGFYWQELKNRPGMTRMEWYRKGLQMGSWNNFKFNVVLPLLKDGYIEQVDDEIGVGDEATFYIKKKYPIGKRKASPQLVVQRHVKEARGGTWRKHIPADLSKGFQQQADALEKVLKGFEELMKKAGGKHLDDAYKKQENLKKQIAKNTPNFASLSRDEQADVYYGNQEYADIAQAVSFLESFYQMRIGDHKIHQAIDKALDHLKDMAALRY